MQNAITFTERGAVDVRVTASASGMDTWVEFEVVDTGIGMTDEHLDTLFRPFTQAAPFAPHGHLGIGLGLAICARLVDLMDGRLTVGSTLGESSTFTFGVPLAPASDGD